jgi:hypothetical protein
MMRGDTYTFRVKREVCNSSKAGSVGGFRLFSSREEVVTNEYIDLLRDQENV